jgi:hypothetical protein
MEGSHQIDARHSLHLTSPVTSVGYKSISMMFYAALTNETFISFTYLMKLEIFVATVVGIQIRR